MRGKGMALVPINAPRPFVSEGLTPETDTWTRTSPGPGSDTAIWPTSSTSRAAPLRSYHTARISRWPGGVGVDIAASSTACLAPMHPAPGRYVAQHTHVLGA